MIHIPSTNLRKPHIYLSGDSVIEMKTGNREIEVKTIIYIIIKLLGDCPCIFEYEIIHN